MSLLWLYRSAGLPLLLRRTGATRDVSLGWSSLYLGRPRPCRRQSSADLGRYSVSTNSIGESFDVLRITEALLSSVNARSPHASIVSAGVLSEEGIHTNYDTPAWH